MKPNCELVKKHAVELYFRLSNIMEWALRAIIHYTYGCQLFLFSHKTAMQRKMI